MIPLLFFAGFAACAIGGTFALQKGHWVSLLAYFVIGVACAFLAIQTLPTAVGH